MKQPAPLPERPYRDGALLNLLLAGLILLISWLTGGDAARALVFALGFFLISTAWTWWRLRQRIERERQ